MSLKTLAFKHLERNTERNKSGTKVFHEAPKKEAVCSTPAEVFATGYGCGNCGQIIYRQVVDGWQCESCGIVFEIVGGSRGPKLIKGL